MKKVMSAFLCLTSILTVLFSANINSVAATYYDSYVYNGNIITWFLDSDMGVLEISGDGEMGDFNTDDNKAGWSAYSQLVTDVKIENGITTIGANAFADFKNLKSAEIPVSVISVEIGAFDNCESLASVSYSGTKDEWSSVIVREDNEALCAAAINCSDGTADETVITPDEKQPTPSTPDIAAKETTVDNTDAATESPDSNNNDDPVQMQSTVSPLNDGDVNQSTTTNQSVESKSNRIVKSLKTPKTKITKLKAGKKKITVSWKKASNINGYQIQAATDKKFKKNKKTVNIKKQKTTKITVKKLKLRKKYYVRVRTYKIVGGKKIYSKWSKIKTIKTK